MESSLNQKTYVVTGATSGIGQAVADQLAAQGAFVIGIGRSPERCRETEHRLRTDHPSARIEFCVADLALQSQVRQAAAQINEVIQCAGINSLDGLVNNAGTFTLWMALTAEGYETQWAVNHLASFLLTHELLPLLNAAPQARVITVSSGSHYGARLKWDDIQLRRGYTGLRAYGQTKLANVLFSSELNRHLTLPSTIKAFAADPGLVNTNLGGKGNPGLVQWVWNLRKKSGIPAPEAARGIIYLVCEPSIQNSTEIYWKHGSPKAPDPYALDTEAARRLWAISSQMCGLDEETYR